MTHARRFTGAVMILRKSIYATSDRPHLRRMVRGLCLASGLPNFHHTRSTQDFECRGIVAGCAITRGSFVIDHHPTLHRSQRRCEAEGGGDVKGVVVKKVDRINLDSFTLPIHFAQSRSFKTYFGSTVDCSLIVGYLLSHGKVIKTQSRLI